jgi:hypothetical protein
VRALAVVALLAFAGCTDPAKAHGTALFITSTWDAGLDVTQLFFTGNLSGGSDVFTPSYRPEQGNGTLPSPQSVRVLLASGFGGSPVTVEVVGYNADGSPVAYGSKGATITDGIEVSVDVKLLPPVALPPSDGGVASGSDGGVASGDCAACGTDCCVHGFDDAVKCLSDEPQGLRRYLCGKGGTTCLGCDPLVADACDVTRGCVCGDAGSCGPGTFCYQGRCVCGPPSCPGCCTAEGACVMGDAADQCGTGGLHCESCSSGAVGGSCVSGVCTTNKCGLMTVMGKCLSGLSCADAGAGSFPFCNGIAGGTTNDACKACDYQSADSCTDQGCICAEQGQTCKSGQLCVSHGCVNLPQELRSR